MLHQSPVPLAAVPIGVSVKSSLPYWILLPPHASLTTEKELNTEYHARIVNRGVSPAGIADLQSLANMVRHNLVLTVQHRTALNVFLAPVQERKPGLVYH